MISPSISISSRRAGETPVSALRSTSVTQSGSERWWQAEATGCLGEVCTREHPFDVEGMQDWVDPRLLEHQVEAQNANPNEFQKVRRHVTMVRHATNDLAQARHLCWQAPSRTCLKPSGSNAA
jgi:hypothetical protein